VVDPWLKTGARAKAEWRRNREKAGIQVCQASIGHLNNKPKFEALVVNISLFHL